MNYQEIWTLQKQLVKARIEKKVSDLLLFLEHNPVITLGKKGTQKDVNTTIPNNIPVIVIERGGKATYHGPGQLVIYFILNLDENNISIPYLMRFIEKWLSISFNEIGLKTKIGTGPEIGLWIDDKKIVSFGFSVRNNVTFHGIAINITTNLDHFQFLSPCGFSSDVMTSLFALGYYKWTPIQFKDLLISTFPKLNQTRINDFNKDSLFKITSLIS